MISLFIIPWNVTCHNYLYTGVCLVKTFVIPPGVLTSRLMVGSLRMSITALVRYLLSAYTDIPLIDKISLLPG